MPPSAASHPSTSATEATDRERGSSTAEFAVATPLIGLLMMLLVQLGLAWHAVHVADAVVTRAADAARLAGATNTDGQRAAQTLVNQLGSGLLTQPTVTITRTGGQITVDLSARTPTVVPGLRWTVHRHATAPIEQITGGAR